MKVLVLNKMYSPDLGGVEVVAEKYVDYLDAKIYQITVLTSSPSLRFKKQVKKHGNIKIITCPSFGMFGSMPISFSLIFYYLSLKKKSFDVAHLHMPSPILTLLLFLKKVSTYTIVTYHCEIAKRNRILKNIVVFFQKKALNDCDVITTTSLVLSNYEILKKHKNKTFIVPLSSKAPEIIKNNFQKGYFLSFGRISNYKGLLILSEALNKITKIKRNILIVGKGNNSIEKKIKNLEKKLKYVKFINIAVDDSFKEILFQNCYCFIFPSIKISEAFGITQLEALKYGKPVINTNLNSGVPWVSVDKVTGITIDINDSEQLKEAILYFDNLSEKEYNNFSSNCLLRFKNIFNEENEKKNIQMIYQNLLEKK